MFPDLRHEHTRVPVTALTSCGPLLVAAEGPYLRFYKRQDDAYLFTKRIFSAQAVHGLSIVSETSQSVNLVVWGGLLVRALTLNLTKDNVRLSLGSSQSSNVVRVTDWILYLHPAPFTPKSSGLGGIIRCAAVTAHNALLELNLHYEANAKKINQTLAISIVELTSSSRSILYSAHLVWESQHRILVAAGTAFGEIIYWSWDQSRNSLMKSRIHHIFLGHEGSIFGVQISYAVDIANAGTQRLVASCSDDRTIRIWNVSGAAESENESLPEGRDGQERTRHTGFSNPAFDTNVSNSDCLAIGWGHTSRVWTVQFLEQDSHAANIFLISSGEDASSRTWQLLTTEDRGTTQPSQPPWQLRLLDTAVYHNGKNIWAITVPSPFHKSQPVILGGADSKITSFYPSFSATPKQSSEYTVEDITESRSSLTSEILPRNEANHRSSKLAEFLRSYAFLDKSSFILTTNSGKVFLERLAWGLNENESAIISRSELVDQPKDLTGYSVCAGEQSLGVVFIAGSRGSLYAYTKNTNCLKQLCIVKGKIGDMFTMPVRTSSDAEHVMLLLTLVGQKTAQLLHVNSSTSEGPNVLKTYEIPISELLTGLTISSMAYVTTSPQQQYTFLGFRRGSIGVYRLPDRLDSDTEEPKAELFRIVDSVHDRETVTTISWLPGTSASSGHLVSTGRNGCLSVHYVDLTMNSIYLVNKITLPIGPNIEGLYFHENQLLVYGFSGKRFVLYSNAAEEEVMSVETGGAHRSWAFQPYLEKQGGGTLVWTRASSMHIKSQRGSNHRVIRSGGHGREIKAVAISNNFDNGANRQLIATGAEDTDIKIFEYENGDLVCRRTLRKHTTGIQHLQWSEDGEYLFSSGGCEEFYIWRVRKLPPELGSIGVVCENICEPQSEHSDLRIMSFDAVKKSTGYLISMVFSDSHIRVYSYDADSASRWHTLATGVYFTSCLTQCVFLSSYSILTTGTDGHAVLWPLTQSILRPHTSDPAPPETLSWKHPARIHQNTSKTLAMHHMDEGQILVVSGGDDGSLAFLLANSSTTDAGMETSYAYPPIIVTRTHASAVTACAILTSCSRIFILTSGNDEWVRLWEIIPHLSTTAMDPSNPLEIKRLQKIKTNVADVSSMAVFREIDDGKASRVLLCGVGMEVIRVEWEQDGI